MGFNFEGGPGPVGFSLEGGTGSRQTEDPNSKMGKGPVPETLWGGEEDEELLFFLRSVFLWAFLCRGGGA